MRSTRSTNKTPAKATEDAPSEANGTNKVATLAPTTSNPPMLMILPDNTSPEARIVTLPNPVDSTPGRYYICPERGLYEFTKTAAPKKTPRSWLLAPTRTEKSTNGSETHTEDAMLDEAEGSKTSSTTSPTDVSQGYAIQDASILLATPLDPLFVLLPALIPKPEETKQLFLSIDDHLDALAENSKHLKQLIRSDKLRQSFERRAAAVCDTVDAGDETMYRLSNQKLVAELLRKAKAMTANPLPASMEQHFVQDALKAPVMMVQRQDTSNSIVSEQLDGEETPVTTAESQTSTTTITPSSNTQDSTMSVATDATAAPSPSTSSAPDQVTNLLRLRTAFSFILSSYIIPTLRPTLLDLLSSSTSPIDFKPLDAQLERIAALKKEQHALRSVSDNISRKRSGYDDEAAEDIRAEKRRKKEEEDAKKKAVSRSIKQLSKVDTSGMKKMSSFFTKAPKKT